MRPTKYIIPLLLLAASTAQAQRAVLIQLPTGGYIGIAYAADGTQVLLTDVIILNLPDPTPPPATATTTVLLMESGDSDQATAILVAGIRSNPAMSKLVTILDPDTEDENGNPDKAVKAAKALIKNAALPCLIGFDAGGKAVAFVPVKGLEDVESALKKWGL